MVLFFGVRVGSLLWTDGRGQMFLVPATRRMVRDKKCPVFKATGDKVYLHETFNTGQEWRGRFRKVVPMHKGMEE